MPDMTEWDQENYGAGYGAAERDIKNKGIKYAIVMASTEKKFADINRVGGPNWYSVGYVTAVSAWREGVRL